MRCARGLVWGWVTASGLAVHACGDDGCPTPAVPWDAGQLEAGSGGGLDARAPDSDAKAGLSASELDAGRADRGDASGVGAQIPDATAVIHERPDGSAFDASSLDEGGAPSSMALRGRIAVGPGRLNDVDWLQPSELNDTLDVLNDDRDRAQLIEAPSWVSGYLGPRTGVASPGTDAGNTGAGITDAGAVGAAADDVDLFRVDLRRGEAITLFIHGVDRRGGTTAPAADLDLYLLDAARHDISEQGQWVADSLGSGSVEQIVVEQSGTYWIAVSRVVQGSSGSDAAARYSLLVGVPVGSSARDAIAANRLTTAQNVALDRVLVKPVSERMRRSTVNVLGYRQVPIAVEGVSGQLARRRALRAIKTLRARRDVSAAMPELRFFPQGLPVPDDPDFARQWHHLDIDLLAGWAQSELTDAPLGSGAVVAVVDTGVALQHPDFVNADGTSQLTSDGYDMVSAEEAAGDGDGRDADPDDPGDLALAGGGTFHGTHCAGNIAAATNNRIGIAGVAPRTKIMPVRVLGRGGGTLDDVVQGVLYAAGLPNDTGQLPARRADILNLSFAGAGSSPPLAEAIAAARDAGVIVIAAAGNFDSPVEQYTPASEPGVVTVSAIDATGQLAWYSNYATTEGAIRLTAVGGDSRVDRTLDGEPDGIYSLLYRDGARTLYGQTEGTSMAAAQVSGVAALMKAVWPAMGPEEFDALLPRMVIDWGGPEDAWKYGAGLLNAPRAVAAAVSLATGKESLGPVLHVSSRALDFRDRFTSLPLTIRNVGLGDLSIRAVTASQPWLSIAPGKEGENWVRIDRSALPAETNHAQLAVDSDAGGAEVAVRAVTSSALPEVDLGPLTVALVDATTGEVVEYTLSSADDGYAFSFDVIEQGAYRVVFSTDALSSGLVGASGDWVGALPVGGGAYCLGEPPEGIACVAVPSDLTGDLDAPVPAPLTGLTLPLSLP